MSAECVVQRHSFVYVFVLFRDYTSLPFHIIREIGEMFFGILEEVRKSRLVITEGWQLQSLEEVREIIPRPSPLFSLHRRRAGALKATGVGRTPPSEGELEAVTAMPFLLERVQRDSKPVWLASSQGLETSITSHEKKIRIMSKLADPKNTSTHPLEFR